MEHGDKTSMRFKGQRIEDLTHAQRIDVQLKVAESERKQLLEGIVAKYPKYDVIQLEAAIRQMEGNIVNLQRVQVEEHTKIKEYRNLVAECQQRDRELESNGFDAGPNV